MFLDVAAVTAGMEAPNPDGLHLSAEAHRAVAEELALLVLPWLREHSGAAYGEGVAG